MYGFWDSALGFLTIAALVIGGLLGGVFLFAHFYGQYQCGNFATITGKETRWAAFDACYIKAESGWERWDEYKLRAAASEGLKAIAPSPR